MAMDKADKEALGWIAAAILVVMLLMYWGRRRAVVDLQNAAGGPPGIDIGSPYFYTNPGFPPPTTNPLPPTTINVNVPSPSFAWLSPYFPLFGFVGVDATQIYQ